MTTDHLPSGTGFLPTDLVRSVDGTEMYRIIEADDTPVVVAVLRVENVTVSRSLTGAMFDDAGAGEDVAAAEDPPADDPGFDDGGMDMGGDFDF